MSRLSGTYTFRGAPDPEGHSKPSISVLAPAARRLEEPQRSPRRCVRPSKSLRDGSTGQQRFPKTVCILHQCPEQGKSEASPAISRAALELRRCGRKPPR
jgi:hypothetical protein